MATKTLVTEAEYLGMTFDGPEPDYVDGELVERAMPNEDHGTVQSVFCARMYPWRTQGLLFAVSELRIQTAPGHYRVVDVAVHRDRNRALPNRTPLVTVEIVSPGDKYQELIAKLAEYKAMGVPNVWIVDPGLRALSVFDGGSLLHVEAFELPEFGLRLTAAELFES